MSPTRGDRLAESPFRSAVLRATCLACVAAAALGTFLAQETVVAQGPRASEGFDFPERAAGESAAGAEEPWWTLARAARDEEARPNAAVPPPLVRPVSGTDRADRAPHERNSEAAAGSVVSAQFDDDGNGGVVATADGPGLSPAGVFAESYDGANGLPGGERPYYWQLLPDGLLYKSYLAGEKEPRISSVWLWEKGRGWVWETTLGGRVGLLRHGTLGAVQPRGFQIDLEGAAFPRIDPVNGSILDAVDFRAGCIGTWKFDWSWGATAIKAGYYHISSHVGDEYLLENPGFPRIEYVRDSTILGLTHYFTPDWSVYGEFGYAIGHEGGARPLEFQFGAQYSPAIADGLRGSPFAAVNGHVREEFDDGGSINVEAGWQWRGPLTDRLFRVGMQYYNGKALQYQFFDKHEELLGLGMWFDY